MTDQTTTEDPEVEAGAEGEDGKGPASGRRIPGKKLVLFIILPFLLIGTAGGGIYASGVLDSLLGIEEQDGELVAEADWGPSVFYEVPPMLVNLNTSGRKVGYLKLSVSLEVGSEEDFPKLDAVLPRIVDDFQVYLRELRVEDLRGSAGLQRLREELFMRVANAAAPTVVRDVLFREMLIQ
jgi:flagellar FliL protein